MKTRLVLIRHGHTSGNGPRMRMSGWTNVPLSPQGWGQVEALRRRLRQEPPFAAIYSSPLQRARDLAQTLSDSGLGALRLHPGLREISCGTLDGVDVNEVQQHFPELWEANLRQEDEHFRWPGGESYREFRERSLATLEDIASRHPGQRVAVVTHAGFISQVLGALHGLSPARWEEFRPGNTALTEVDWSGRTGELLHYDDAAHLQEPPPAQALPPASSSRHPHGG